jgi:sugar lactone lactonase YvrE
VIEQTSSVLVSGLRMPECPRWRHGRLWFSDILARQVLTVDMKGKTAVVAEVPGGPGGLGWLPDGRLLIVSMFDKRLLRLDNDRLVAVADLSEFAPFGLNDMVVDSHGRAYIGHRGFDLLAQPVEIKPGHIILVTPDGHARVIAENVMFPNGAVITPDGRKLIVAEPAGARISCFDIEKDGSLVNRRVWAQFGPPESEDSVVPDGICLDVEGALWVASPVPSQKVFRIREGGEVTHRVKPQKVPYACTLGGPDARTLFIPSSMTYPDVEWDPGHYGQIEMVTVEVAGTGSP